MVLSGQKHYTEMLSDLRYRIMTLSPDTEGMAVDAPPAAAKAPAKKK
jgi:hypothetical protein